MQGKKRSGDDRGSGGNSRVAGRREVWQGRAAGVKGKFRRQRVIGEQMQARRAGGRGQIHSTFAICLPGCITLLMVPRSSGTQAATTAGRGTTGKRRRTGDDGLSQTVFVLEDDSDIARLVQHHLEAAGFAARLYQTPTNVIGDAERQPPALFLLDIMVPGGSGLDVCRRLRANPALSTIPIIFMTARAGENDRVLGLEMGADDYITKPFATRELVARVKAVLRRFERPTTPAVISFEEVVIDANAMQLTVRGTLTTTTATEFRLLDYLARHPGRVFGRDHLLDAVWGDARFVTPRSVDVYVRRIREKIEIDPENPRYLKTVRGAGYRFEIPKGE